MCTAVTYKTKDLYFGRTLDYEFSYGEEIVISPRKYPFSFTNGKKYPTHNAIIGTAHVADGYPLYYDAVNEKGLCAAGLNFVGNAVYSEVREPMRCVAQYEFIPWILGICDSVADAIRLLKSIDIVGVPFGEHLPVALLHWIIADRHRSITVESVAGGLRIYDNPVGVLTNNPPFDIQLFNLNNYMSVSPKAPENRFSDKLDLEIYSRGMGGIGLPGDLSSASRFVKASFVKMNSVSDDTEAGSVGQFFHILGSVEQPRGCCEVGGKYEITVYTCCYNADKGIYYYTTYKNHRISAVDMHKEDLEGDRLIRYPHTDGEQINYLN